MYENGALAKALFFIYIFFFIHVTLKRTGQQANPDLGPFLICTIMSLICLTNSVCDTQSDGRNFSRELSCALLSYTMQG